MDRARLASAKAEAEALFAASDYDALFRFYLEARRGIPPERVVFHRAAACRRIREAALLSVRESAERADAIEGETDGETIWIVRGLSRAQMVDVLLHEALHGACTLDNREICEKDEHQVIRQLGDEW